MMLLALMAAACVAVSGPIITARDIAMVVPGYVPQDASAVFGYSPMPGVQRVVRAVELQPFLKRDQFTGTVPEGNFCFERPTALITERTALPAMQAALGPEAQIEIVEMSRFPAPMGTVVFDRRDLGNPPIAFWHGSVVYDGNRKFPIWARVKLSVHAMHMMALEDLRPGTPIRADQVALQAVDEFPGSRVTPSEVSKVVGAMPRRYINAHTPLWEDCLDAPNQITKGDRVSVTVQSGRARLIFDAEAEMSGRNGEVVSFKNPESGKVFRARVEGPDQALIETPNRQP